MKRLSLLLMTVAVGAGASAGPLKIRQIIYETHFGPSSTSDVLVGRPNPPAGGYRVTLDVSGAASYETLRGVTPWEKHRGTISTQDFARLSVLIQKVKLLDIKDDPVPPEAATRRITIVTNRGRKVVTVTGFQDPPAFWAVDRLTHLLASSLMQERDPEPVIRPDEDTKGQILIEVLRTKKKG